MAIFAAIRNQKQTTGAMKGAILYIVDSRKTLYNGDDLVSALHCMVYTSYVEMMMTKRQFRKEGGRQFYQFVQSPDFEDCRKKENRYVVENGNMLAILD